MPEALNQFLASDWPWWIALVGGLLGTALLSGIETGLYVLNRVRLTLRAAHGPRRWSAQVVSRELEHPERMLAANLIANLICGDLVATAATRLLERAGYSDGVVIAVNAVVLTPVFFVMVESVPKELFRLEADRLTYRFAWALPAVRWALTVVPAVPLVRLLTGGLARLMGGERGPGGDFEQSARERVASLLKDTVGHGPLSESQAGLVDRALAFQSGTVGAEMVPWAEVRIVGERAGPAELRAAIEPGSAYVPVVDAARGRRVVGVVWHADAFLRPGAPVGELLVEPARLTPRTPLPEAVAMLRRARAPVGIVEDGGRAVGMVTMDDVIGPLVEDGPEARA